MNAKETPALFSNSPTLLGGAPIRRPPSSLETKSHSRLKCHTCWLWKPSTQAPKRKWRLGMRPAQQLMLLFSVISKPYSASTMTHRHGSGVRRSCLVNTKKWEEGWKAGLEGQTEQHSSPYLYWDRFLISHLDSFSHLPPKDVMFISIFYSQ